MTENEIMCALFTQQRMQIMQLGKYHDEFSDAYLYAWASSVYPIMSDTDGSVPRKPHETYAPFFITSKEKVDFLLTRLDSAWRKKDKITFYDLEDELGVRGFSSQGWERGNLIAICRYLYLDGCFDKSFWSMLLQNGKCPAEALGAASAFNRDTEVEF